MENNDILTCKDLPDWNNYDCCPDCHELNDLTTILLPDGQKINICCDVWHLLPQGSIAQKSISEEKD